MVQKSIVKLHLNDLNYPHEKIVHLDHHEIMDWFNYTLKGLSSTTSPIDYTHIRDEGLVQIDNLGMQAADLFLTRLVNCIHSANIPGVYDGLELYNTGEILLVLDMTPITYH